MPRILLVDDEPSIRAALTRALKRDGHQVLSAPDGRQALEVATRESPELVVTDIRMAAMDGLELLRHLGQLEPSIPAIVMSAYTTAETTSEALRLGATCVLAKPFKLPELREAIERALQEQTPAAAESGEAVEVPSAASISLRKGPHGGGCDC